MVEYRVPEFTLEQRVAAAVQMLVPLPERKWGLVSELARLYAVPRKRLYEIRDQAGEAILAALPPRAETVSHAGRRAFVPGAEANASRVPRRHDLGAHLPGPGRARFPVPRPGM
jgi:hypothetical protein